MYTYTYTYMYIIHDIDFLKILNFKLLFDNSACRQENLLKTLISA